MKPCAIVALVSLLLCACSGYSQTGASYEALIQQGKAQLQTGHADRALATAEQAIKLDTKNWEGYALAGGAQMNLKRYDEAISRFTEAMDRAPQDKQAGLSDLRKQCFEAEFGTTASASTPPARAANSSAPEATTTQAEIVLWKSIESSSNPEDFQTYLNQYPNGAFAPLARQHLTALQAAIQKQQEEAEKSEEEARAPTWTDPVTRLTWARSDGWQPTTDETFNSLTWQQAFAYCASLRLSGLSGWRLPEISELDSIYDPSQTVSGPDGEYHLKGGIKPSGWVAWSNNSGDKQGQFEVMNLMSGRHFSDRQKYSWAHIAICVASAKR